LNPVLLLALIEEALVTLAKLSPPLIPIPIDLDFFFWLVSAGWAIIKKGINTSRMVKYFLIKFYLKVFVLNAASNRTKVRCK
jgi:hypothetical protein